MESVKKVIWRLYFLVFGRPNIEETTRKLAEMSANIVKPQSDRSIGNPCDCAIYLSSGEEHCCMPGIETELCVALHGGRYQTVVNKVGTCATLPMRRCSGI